MCSYIFCTLGAHSLCQLLWRTWGHPQFLGLVGEFCCFLNQTWNHSMAMVPCKKVSKTVWVSQISPKKAAATRIQLFWMILSIKNLITFNPSYLAGMHWWHGLPNTLCLYDLLWVPVFCTDQVVCISMNNINTFCCAFLYTFCAWLHVQDFCVHASILCLFTHQPLLFP